MPPSWDELQSRIVACEACPRLRAHCKDVAQKKRASFRDWDYWGRPVPNFGDPAGRLLIVGLAPAAHGANRTGRMFTGDRSGDFLYEALYRIGFANQPEAVSADDGLELHDCVITAAAHCAPPQNKPTTEELATCRPFLVDTIANMPHLRAFLCLGGIGYDAVVRFFREQNWNVPSPKPKFAHGAIHDFGHGSPRIACTYHPSQQNTFTGRLTMDMLCNVLTDIRKVIET